MFYEHHDPAHLRQIDARKDEWQAELWSAILPAAAAQQTPVVLAIALGLIADIEAPRSGSILIAPHNLSALKASLRGP